jgi:hypothetical protein
MKTKLLILIILYSSITSKTVFNVHLSELPLVTITVDDGKQPLVTDTLRPYSHDDTKITASRSKQFWPWQHGYTYCLRFEGDSYTFPVYHCHNIVDDDGFVNDFAAFWGVTIDWTKGDEFLIWDYLDKPTTLNEQQFKDNLSKVQGRFIFIDDSGLYSLK